MGWLDGCAQRKATKHVGGVHRKGGTFSVRGVTCCWRFTSSAAAFVGTGFRAGELRVVVGVYTCTLCF